ncbi:hypothetical protein LQW54_012194 [Pestalotiopsis sp. IQ-011]
MAPVILNIAYPSGSDFNVDYYTSRHIPFALGAWQKLGGLVGWKLYTPVGEGSPYAAHLEVTWDGIEAVVNMKTNSPPEVQKALADDLPNYSTKPPAIWVSELKASL